MSLLLSEVEITAEDIPGWSVASKAACGFGYYPFERTQAGRRCKKADVGYKILEKNMVLN